jgi:hypothetical protein
MNFAQNYCATSNNIENLRAKKDITSVATAHLCAGPAVPLIYEFMKTKNPDLPRILEDGNLTAD